MKMPPKSDGTFVTASQLPTLHRCRGLQDVAVRSGWPGGASPPTSWILSCGGWRLKNRMLSISNVAPLEVPPIDPKNKSTCWPLQSNTSISRLAETVFVGINCACKENKFVSPMPQTSESCIGSPEIVKSNPMARAVEEGFCTGTQTMAGVFDINSGCGLFGCGKPFVIFGLGAVPDCV